MTQTRSDEAENRTRNPEGSVPEERTTSDSRPFGESSMDRDAGERSAREKLKKASLASLGAHEEQISTDYQAEQPNAFAADDLGNLNSRRVSNQEHSSATSSQIQEEKSASHESCESKAQPVTEDRAKPDINEISVTENQHQDLEQLYPVDDEGDVQTRVLSNTSVINDGNMSRNQSSNLFTHGDNEIEGTGGNTNSKLRNHNDTASLSKDANTNVNNSREEEKGTASPRKKRSRDQLDPEIDREQKIAATEEARAQRLSTEADRPDIDTSSQQNLNDDRRSGDARSAFGNTSQVKAAGVAHRLGSPGDDTNRASVSDAFASSGFAVLANSTTSPFGTISSSGSGLTGFASFASIRKLSSDKSNDGGQGLSSAKSNDSDLEPPDKRKDLSTVFGGPVFGQGFSAGGSKLSTFAAPKGDAHLGGDIDTIKPMGSVELQGKDVVEIASDSGDIDNEIGKEESPNDADDRFYTQKGRDCSNSFGIASRS